MPITQERVEKLMQFKLFNDKRAPYNRLTGIIRQTRARTNPKKNRQKSQTPKYRLPPGKQHNKFKSTDKRNTGTVDTRYEDESANNEGNTDLNLNTKEGRLIRKAQ